VGGDSFLLAVQQGYELEGEEGAGVGGAPPTPRTMYEIFVRQLASRCALHGTTDGLPE
jgi:hypothetical protein